MKYQVLFSLKNDEKEFMIYMSSAAVVIGALKVKLKVIQGIDVFGKLIVFKKRQLF